MGKAGRGWRQDVAFAVPMPADEERCTLLEVRDEEIEDQDDVLVVADADDFVTVSAPGDDSQGDEDDESRGAGHGESRKDGDGDQADAQTGGELGQAVGRREVVVAVEMNEWRVWVWHGRERRKERRSAWHWVDACGLHSTK